MKEKLADLINVKSIVTLIATGVFSYLAIIGKISSEQFMTVFVMIMTYFFAKKETPTGETTSTSTITTVDDKK